MKICLQSPEGKDKGNRTPKLSTIKSLHHIGIISDWPQKFGEFARKRLERRESFQRQEIS